MQKPGYARQSRSRSPAAFVKFGAGMRQKEIDKYTAQQKIEARYTAGAMDGAGRSGISLSCSCGALPASFFFFHKAFNQLFSSVSSAHQLASSIMLLGGSGFLGPSAWV